MNWIDPRQWKVITAPVQGKPGARSAAKLLEISRQFKVATEERYKPSPGVTWCNIFLWDVTRALGCEIPHFFGGGELTANKTVDWLDAHGAENGWIETQPEPAERKASVGLPVVAVWKNPKGHGHVALVVPNVKPGLWITQAGGHNFDERPIVQGFGAISPRFFGHL